ncbi:MAG: hypothetical protein VCF07_07955, partial [Nitrospinota bacterium]
PLEGEPVMFVPGENQLLDARHAGWIEDMRLTGTPVPELCGYLRSHDVSRGKIGVSSLTAMPSGAMEHLRSELPNAAFIEASSAVFDARERKSGEELEAARRGGRVADLGWKRSLEILRPGMSELE